MKNFYHKVYFNFDCEWTQLIKNFITKTESYNWYDITFLLFSYDLCNNISSAKLVNKNDNLFSLTINVGILGFIFIIMIDRFKKQ